MECQRRVSWVMRFLEKWKMLLSQNGGVWKLNCPFKIKIFFRLVLDGKISVWHTLKHKFLAGTSICPLCELDAESIFHLFIHFPYARDLWNHLSHLADLPLFWTGADVQQAWLSWSRSTYFTSSAVLLVFAIWGIWLSRNMKLFEDVLV